MSKHIVRLSSWFRGGTKCLQTYNVNFRHCHIDTMAKSWPKVFMFGDSLTQYGYSQDGCWVALVGDFLQRKCDLINRGFSGYNTRFCKIILPKLINQSDAKEVQLVTILLGANDSVDATLCPKQHVPLKEFKENMRSIVQHFLDVGVERQKIVIISPPPCVEHKWEADCKENGRAFGKFNGPTKEYAAGCLEVAEDFGVAGIDLYNSMMKQENWEEMLNDGLHFSASGSEHVYKLLKPHLEKVADAVPFQWPYWADIDNQNPHAVLDKL